MNHVPCQLNAPLVDQLIALAIAEDIGHGDITTSFLHLSGKSGIGRIKAKAPLVLAGIEMVSRVFGRFDPDAVCRSEFKDGDRILPGTIIAEVDGDMGALLTGERTALNFLQRLSGVATHVRCFVDLLSDSPLRLVDTRKTVPGWRILDKYAVRVGGAGNHRMGLYDGVLIKDNHIAAAGGIGPAVEQIRKQVPHLIRIEVEVTTSDEVREAVAAGADIIMLDNMDLDAVKQAVAIIDGQALVEVSGQVGKDQLLRLAETGVDIVSVGALTHAAVFVDISMDIVPRHAS